MGIKEVAAGAAWLDENFPGWEREIDLGTFDINACKDCVLGQSVTEAAALTVVKRDPYDNGISSYFILYDHYGIAWIRDHAFASELNEPLWRDLIKERFNTGNLSDADLP